MERNPTIELVWADKAIAGRLMMKAISRRANALET
jgi:hypothetical protein